MLSQAFQVRAQALPGSDRAAFAPSSLDARHILRAVDLADDSSSLASSLTAPHPNAGCVIVRHGKIVGEGSLRGQGTPSAESQAVEKAGEHARGAIAYVNLEPGVCHGDDQGVRELQQAGVSRVVVGLRHPLQHFRGKSIKTLRSAGIRVDVLGEDLKHGNAIEEALKACQMVNAPLLYREAYKTPFSTLKYAMTLDGKIAASTGHASWVSSKQSRQRVLAIRGRSDAVIVGGNTVRRDNPQLTTRQEGGHRPTRIVMSKSLNVPENANLWDVSSTPTIVMTQRGARKDLQMRLEEKGVEIVEFDFLTPKGVMDYCYDRGFLSVLWECGGTLAAPAIAFGVIHKVVAFIAPKIIGGLTAPSPVGELGMVEMTQALNLTDVLFEQIGPDMLITGYLKPFPDLSPMTPTLKENPTDIEVINASSNGPRVISFRQSWDAYGGFSNFSPHPITMPSSNGKLITWRTVEHYYQAQKFEGVEDSLSLEFIKAIQEAETPEEAVRLGQAFQRQHPHLVRWDWESSKADVMYSALRSKFSTYPFLKPLLLSTLDSLLVEASPSGGARRESRGQNCLGQLLMKLRDDFQKEVANVQMLKSSMNQFLELAG